MVVLTEVWCGVCSRYRWQDISTKYNPARNSIIDFSLLKSGNINKDKNSVIQ